MASFADLIPTVSWAPLEDQNYSKLEVYEMQWLADAVRLENVLIVGAPYGGPIAMVRDENVVQKANFNSGNPITIYTSSGVRLAQFEWTQGRIVKMGWSDDERLVVVSSAGMGHVFDIHGTFVTSFSIGHNLILTQAYIWGRGLVAMTIENKFVVVEFRELGNTREGNLPQKFLADPGLFESPRCWAVIPAEVSPSRTVEVLLATRDNRMLSLYGDDFVDLTTDGVWTMMAISASGDLCAYYSEDGRVHVVKADFSANLTTIDIDLNGHSAPTGMTWCGSDAVVLSWPDKLIVFGPKTGQLRYDYFEPYRLINECDSLRIVTDHTMEILRLVSADAQAVFQTGSREPGALLLEALLLFDQQKPEADQVIREIKNYLAEATDSCINAAGYEFSTRLQRRLMSAASFGKCFMEFYSPDKFVSMAKTLRVLNAVRSWDIGIPLTFDQYLQLSPQVLVNRLVYRNKHLLAYRVCAFLELPSDSVLIHWACAKVIKGDGSDQDLCAEIVHKLRKIPGVSYSSIAETAHTHNHPELAKLLLDYEPRAAEQVKLLVRMNETEHALVKAIESGDTDLCYYVLLGAMNRVSESELFYMVQGKPVAVDLLVKFLAQQNPAMLARFYELHDDQRYAATALLVRRAYLAPSMTERVDRLNDALALYKASKELQFEAAMTKDQGTLFKFQFDLRQRTTRDFVGWSLSETIFECARLGMIDSADKCRDLFSVPPKRYYWVMLRALASTANWKALEQLAKGKSPIGFKPFVDACADAGAPLEAAKYIAKLSSLEERVDAFVKIGLFREAADEALKGRKLELLESVAERCPNEDARSYVRIQIAKLAR